MSYPDGVSLADCQKKDAQYPASSTFQRYPTLGEVKLSHGETVPIPWRAWSASALLIWGSADVDYVKKLIKGPWVPVIAKDGRAHMCFWLVKYADSSLHPYNEFILVFTVVHESKQHLVQGRQNTYDVIGLLNDHIAQPYVYKLWVTSGTAIDFGRELGGLDKYPQEDGGLNFQESCCTAYADFKVQHVRGEVNDPPPEMLIRGKLRLEMNLCGGCAICGLLGAFGLCKTLSMASGLAASWEAVTPPGIQTEGYGKTMNPVFEFATESNPRFTSASASDDLETGGELKAMNFKAHLYMHDPAMKAVMLLPWTFASL
eukprot:TRINITY_DN24643_c0_g1_i2.p1 TRINITY_DN24643_c0_g1~~TRINITY_DN24643_c0_g1_i2.p1  ORF type:complete len:316 (+),score=73.79 TRINITY_DN24643_c0_g1_i2:328-1275(+)